MKTMKEKTNELKIGYNVYSELFDALMVLAEQGWTKDQLKQLTSELGRLKWLGSYVYHLNNFADRFVLFLERIGV